MSIEEELSLVLPADLPHRAEVAAKSARHLELIAEVNPYLNLTRISSPREAAVKHVLDSVLPWRLFAGAKHVLDAGTGAGFPGIPLAVVFPDTRFTLAESTQKKARFVESAVEALGLTNADVVPERAEDVLRRIKPDVVTARAVAPLSRAAGLFAPAIRSGAKVLLYKGPDVDTEIEEASDEARKRKIRMRVVERYQLPDSLGARTIVELFK